jgi:hypothetical protein
MQFQTQVNLYPAPGLPGTQASANPVATVDAGDGALVAGTNGVTVANFGWISGTTNLGGGTVLNVCPTTASVAPFAPDGLVLNQHEALITDWLGQSSLVIPQGVGCTLAERGDFWSVSNYGPAVRGQKVFANLFNGAALVAAAGSFPVTNIGANASFTATITAGVMNVSAVTSGTLAAGQLVQGTNVPANTYIATLGTGTGGTGTYNLTQTTLTLASEALTSVTPAGIGGASVIASASDASATLTVASVNYGTVNVGMPVSGTSIPAGAYIASLGTGTGGDGTYVLSANTTGTITSATVTLSAWIETPWYALSDGNPGDLIKIGVKN